MGKTTLLVSLEDNLVRALFSDLRTCSEEFYNRWYKVGLLDNGMCIIGRLDFLTDKQLRKVEQEMESYKSEIDKGDTEAIYLVYKDNLIEHGKLENGLLRIGMYG